MSPFRYGNADMFVVDGSDNPGQLGWTGVKHADGVVRLSNFSSLNILN